MDIYKRPQNVKAYIDVSSSKGRKIEEFVIYLDDLESQLDRKEKYLAVINDSRIYALEIKKDLREICNLYFTEHMI